VESNGAVNNVTDFHCRKAVSGVRKSCVGDDGEMIFRHQPKSIRAIRGTGVLLSTGKSSSIVLDENTNAVKARINREKQKAYISNLKQQVVDLKSEYSSMKAARALAVRDTSFFEEEIKYLKGVLANQSALSNLIKNINGDSNMRVQTSSRPVRATEDGARKRLRADDQDWGRSQNDRKYSRGPKTTRRGKKLNSRRRCHDITHRNPSFLTLVRICIF